ncbi:protein kinase C delta type-like [Ranitomeya imitator]|uniref:protein kinase C delta type-like n=1 Tax=Ranitomeya imitator TaxID=111125 RepID=UPI0037E8F9D2
MAEDTETRQEFAVKIISKRALLAGGDMLDVMVERHVLQLASGSPFLVYADFGFQTKMNVFLGMEYMSCGDFYQLLHWKGPLDVTSARFYAAKLVCGIQFLHSRGVIHRDLNPENILVAETGHIKITDYGLALENMHGDQTATGFAGTMGYMAPELLQEDPVQRLGVNDNIREHPFFQEIDWVSVEALRMAPPYIPVPTKPKPRFRAFKLDKIQAAEAALSITPEDQAVFRGFSFIT